MSVPLDPLASEATHSAAENLNSRDKSLPPPKWREKSADSDTLRARVYRASDLSRYSLRDRFIIRAAGLFLYFLICVICSTLRWKVQGREHLDSIIASGHRPIFTFWHVCILSATWFWRNRGIVVMSSVSRDAEYTGRVIKRFGYGTARGSSTRGGGRALAEMAQCLFDGIEVGFTIDGPRGPAYIAKPGAVTLARHSGQAILPFHISTRKRIQFPSWDRLQVPLPFARALVLIGAPIYVPRDATADATAAKQAELQSALERLRGEGEAWAKEG